MRLSYNTIQSQDKHIDIIFISITKDISKGAKAKENIRRNTSRFIKGIREFEY